MQVNLFTSIKLGFMSSKKISFLVNEVDVIYCIPPLSVLLEFKTFKSLHIVEEMGRVNRLELYCLLCSITITMHGPLFIVH